MFKSVELKKCHILTLKNYCNFGIYYIIKIFLVLYNIYIVLTNQKNIYFMLTTILIKINSTYYIILISLIKVYKMQIQLLIKLNWF